MVKFLKKLFLKKLISSTHYNEQKTTVCVARLVFESEENTSKNGHFCSSLCLKTASSLHVGRWNLQFESDYLSDCGIPVWIISTTNNSKCDEKRWIFDFFKIPIRCTSDAIILISSIERYLIVSGVLINSLIFLPCNRNCVKVIEWTLESKSIFKFFF